MAQEKKKMQSVSFRNTAEMLDYLPEDQREITLRLQELVWESIPKVKEKLSFNVPYYAVHRNVCFIWPGAVPWGNTSKEGVMLGFTYGNLLDDPSSYLERGDRQQVFVKTFYRPEEIDEDLVRHFLQQAVEVDEMIYREKQQGKKGRKKQ